MSDVKHEISFLESLPGVDPSKLVMMGHSMGATATLTQGYQDTRIKKLVAIVAPHDHLKLIQDVRTFTMKYIKKNVTKQFKQNLQEWNEKVSAKYFIEKGSPMPDKERVYLIHCVHDDLIPIEHAFKNKEALIRCYAWA